MPTPICTVAQYFSQQFTKPSRNIVTLLSTLIVPWLLNSTIPQRFCLQPQIVRRITAQVPFTFPRAGEDGAAPPPPPPGSSTPGRGCRDGEEEARRRRRLLRLQHLDQGQGRRQNPAALLPPLAFLLLALSFPLLRPLVVVLLSLVVVGG